MAKLMFNGHTHQIKLISDAGETVGTWVAYNNVDSRATLTHIQNGSYAVTDRRLPHRHTADANGSYGLHGIIRFAVPGIRESACIRGGRLRAMHRGRRMPRWDASGLRTKPCRRLPSSWGAIH